MIGKALALILILSSALTIGIVAAACDDDGGGGGTVTLEEFFVALQALDDDLEEKSAELDAEGEALGEDATVDEAVAILRQQVELIEEFVNDLDALEAPPEAADLLEEAVSAGGEVVRLFGELLDEAEGTETLDEFFSAFDDAETDAAFQRFEQVCLDLEQLAADNDITVDFNCDIVFSNGRFFQWPEGTQT